MQTKSSFLNQNFQFKRLITTYFNETFNLTRFNTLWKLGLITRDKLINPEDVNFTLNTRKIKNKLCKGPQECYLEPLPIKLIIHGWNESKYSSHYKELIEGYLKRANYNIIQVDWSKLAGLSYLNTVQLSVSIGKQIGTFLIRLLESRLTSHDRIHIIGHSIGAHLGGIAAKQVTKLTGNLIFRISGLDPAKQLFEVPLCPPFGRLQKTDARMVDVTHTDCLLFGFKEPLGTVDYYFNGSGFQPDYPIPSIKTFNSKEGLQSYVFFGHRRSLKYFKDSISNGNIVGWKCDSLREVKKKMFDTNNSVVYGEDAPINTKGLYFVKTF